MADDLTAALEAKRSILLEAAAEPVSDLDAMTRLANLVTDEVPLLVAAVRAALDHHEPAVKHHAEGDSFRYCKTCSGHPAWPCPEVRDITAALTGKDGTDGG